MDRQHVIERLAAEKRRLKERGIVGLSLFGSTARGEATVESDIDLAVRLATDFSDGGFDYFAKLEALREELSALLGMPVDLVEEPVAVKELQARIDKDRIVAFQ